MDSAAMKCWLDSKRSMDSGAQMPRGQAEMREDLGDDGGVFDACPELSKGRR